jgi:ABC-type dipeptide/oligopeptide/nickel transport system permease subunit
MGITVAEGAPFIVSGEWWIAFFPGLALMIAVFRFNLLAGAIHARPADCHPAPTGLSKNLP